MPKVFTPKVVTANDLLEGDVIYLDASQNWVRDLSDAYSIADEDTATAWLAYGAAQTGVAVGVYLMDAKQSATGPEPTHFREDFRRTGPSNYVHGKQEPARRKAA